MKDLRVRFGFILALALLPLLVFSIWRSYDDYRQDTLIRAKNTELAARIAVSDIVESLETSRAVLRFSSTLIARESCLSDLAKIAQEYERFHNVIQTDASGKVQCAARAVRDDGTQGSLIASQLTENNPFSTQIVSFNVSDGRPETVLVTAHGLFKDGKLDSVIAATEDIRNLEGLLQKAEPAEGDQIALFNRHGDLLIGNWRGGDLKALAARTPEQFFTERFQGEDADSRRVSVIPTGDKQIFVGVAAAKQNLLDSNKFNPFSSAIIPIMAWLFGFAAIWLSTDQLILIHLRRMRTATLGFAKGNRDVRVGKMNNPPASIYALGKNFDMMADRIEEREHTIQDALEEKETLLREIHHRVKNNLQIIISLLNMQERKLKDKQGLAAIVETRSRINAIALVHRGLYESEDLRYVNMQTFLDRLIPDLAIAFGLEARKITVETVAKCAPLEADTATPVALFIVEALTNAVKHGVGKGGKINIDITQEEETVSVKVSDDGKTAPQPVNAKGGTGTKLIKGFARQLGGELDIQNEGNGYAVTLNFVPRDLSSNPNLSNP